MGLQVPSAVIVPLFISSFVMLAVQYFRISPERRVLNIRFGLMLGAIVLIFASAVLAHPPFSAVFFLLAFLWLGLALYLFRLMPSPRH